MTEPKLIDRAMALVAEPRMILPVTKKGTTNLRPSFIIGCVAMAVVLLITLIGPLLIPYNPTQQNLRAALRPPSAEHLFGTDNFGRDIFSRAIAAAATDLQIGVIGVFLPLVSCAFAKERCAIEQPLLRDVGGGHLAACHFAEQISWPPAVAG